MKIITCVKQVPSSNNVKIDDLTGVLIRDGSATKMNPYDLYAVEVSLKLKEKTNAHVTTITMGPPQALNVLKETLWMGADDAVLITDRRFGGADVVATSHTISEAIKHLDGFDLIICGKQTTDGDTAQVGPEIACDLDIPHVAYVTQILEVKSKSVIVKTLMDSYIETLEVNLPCLLTIEKTNIPIRLPSYKKGRTINLDLIKKITFDDLDDQNINHYGLNGSPTKVERMFSPNNTTNKVIFKGNVIETTNKIVELLKENKYLNSEEKL